MWGGRGGRRACVSVTALSKPWCSHFAQSGHSGALGLYVTSHLQRVGGGRQEGRRSSLSSLCPKGKAGRPIKMAQSLPRTQTRKLIDLATVSNQDLQPHPHIPVWYRIPHLTHVSSFSAKLQTTDPSVCRKSPRDAWVPEEWPLGN